MTIFEMQERAWKTNEENGFHEPNEFDNLPTRLMLVVSELSEALEELRNGHAPNETYFKPDKPEKPEGIPSELADVVIRCGDIAAVHGIDLESAVLQKMNYNDTRGYKHGGKAC